MRCWIMYAALLLTLVAQASSQSDNVQSVPVEAALLAPLRRAPVPDRLTIFGLMLPTGDRVNLLLDQVEIAAPGATIYFHREDRIEAVSPIYRPTYIGTIQYDPRSVVILWAGNIIDGIIVRGDEEYVVTPANASITSDRPETPYVIRAITDDFRDSRDCDMEQSTVPEEPEDTAGEPTNEVVEVKTALDIDYEMYKRLGSDDRKVRDYIQRLMAIAQEIYRRDVNIELRHGDVHVWAAPNDPWAGTNSRTALREYAAHYQTPPSGHQMMHMLSARSFGGRAWVRTACRVARESFAISGGLTGRLSATDYRQFVDVKRFTHETGHNIGSSHTHCYEPPVDRCATEDGCYSGPVSVPPERGTIMSYCHLPAGGYRNVKLFLGVAGEASEVVQRRIKRYAQAHCN